MSRAQKTFYFQQEVLIRNYLASITEQERTVFYQLDTAGKKLFVSEKGLRIEVEAGEICLTEHQKDFLSRPARAEEQKLLAPEEKEDGVPHRTSSRVRAGTSQPRCRRKKGDWSRNGSSNVRPCSPLLSTITRINQ